MYVSAIQRLAEWQCAVSVYLTHSSHSSHSRELSQKLAKILRSLLYDTARFLALCTLHIRVHINNILCSGAVAVVVGGGGGAAERNSAHPSGHEANVSSQIYEVVVACARLLAA